MLYADLATLCKSTHSQLFTFQPLLFSFGCFRALCYYIAIHQFGDVTNIEIPIFLGDSAIVPVSKKIGNIDCYYYSINNNKSGTLEVVLPKSFVNRADFGKTMSKLQALVKAESPEVLFSKITENFSLEERNSTSLMEAIMKLSSDLVMLHKNQWDGIWIRITTNFMLIARLQRNDMIIGNPPLGEVGAFTCRLYEKD